MRHQKLVCCCFVLCCLFITQAPTVISQGLILPAISPSESNLWQNARPIRAVLPPGSQLELKENAIVFSELELNDGCVLYFVPSVTTVEITVVKLILHGKSTVDLTPRVSLPTVPPTPGEMPQVDSSPNPTQTGRTGAPGAPGGAGTNGISLKLNVQTLEAADGSLWIRTDGTQGGQGGAGGKGGKGSAGPYLDRVYCKDGGNGGTGGTGGEGGKGGDAAKVVLKVGPDTISPAQAAGVAPSNRPTLADVPGTVVIFGAPGVGGPPGAGGPGGNAGEGKECHFPATDARPGSPGSPGPNGSRGPNGRFP